MLEPTPPKRLRATPPLPDRADRRPISDWKSLGEFIIFTPILDNLSYVFLAVLVSRSSVTNDYLSNVLNVQNHNF